MGEGHGLSKTKLYGVWSSMKNRCACESSTSWKNYGGRGIRVCDEWVNSFVAFKEWADQNGYSSGLQLDRIDTNGDYSPSNCRFISPMANSNNRRNSKIVDVNGKKQTIRDICEETGLSYATIAGRLRAGWAIDMVKSTTPLQVRNKKRADTNGFRNKIVELRRKLSISQSELAKMSGFSRQEINMIENGRNDPTISTITIIAHTLGVGLSDLFYEGPRETAYGCESELCFSKFE